LLLQLLLLMWTAACTRRLQVQLLRVLLLD
jgi:hypothetical protein